MDRDFLNVFWKKEANIQVIRRLFAISLFFTLENATRLISSKRYYKIRRIAMFFRDTKWHPKRTKSDKSDF